jgi:hypothetical protein
MRSWVGRPSPIMKRYGGRTAAARRPPAGGFRHKNLASLGESEGGPAALRLCYRREEGGTAVRTRRAGRGLYRLYKACKHYEHLNRCFWGPRGVDDARQGMTCRGESVLSLR